MKKNCPWWWSKMSSRDCGLATSVIVTDYFLAESGTLEPCEDLEDRLFCGPSEDIWKKFELLPTPPRSPSRPSSNSDDEEDLLVPSEPKLNLVSDLLDSPDPAVWGLGLSAPTGLKNDLLHDCMWSGQCTDTCKRGHVIPTPVFGHQTVVKTVTPELVIESTVKVEPMARTIKTEPEDSESPEIKPSPTLPVDPYTMLPYTPLSDHSYHNQQQVKYEKPRTPPVCDTPSDTEDDEIDVVTLPTSVSLTSRPEPVIVTCSKSTHVTPSPPPRRRPPGRPLTVPPLRVVIPSSVLVSKHKEHRRSQSRKRFQKRHNLTSNTSSSVSSNVGWVRRHYKRRFASHHHSNANRTLLCSSDSEDCVEKRSMHNSMERKRRDDLRYAFQTLREHVPELASNPKAPKVLILNRAASYARQLSQTSTVLEKTLKQETRRRQELQRKLMQLSKLK